ncbi:Ionotropic receptor 203 [Blattella germanica]|nr:Ionotropic receptor 203 [Blattella germanica]
MVTPSLYVLLACSAAVFPYSSAILVYPMINCLEEILNRHFLPGSTLVLLQGKEHGLLQNNTTLWTTWPNEGIHNKVLSLLDSLFLMEKYVLLSERMGERKIKLDIKHLNYDGYILLSELEDPRAVYEDLKERVETMRHFIDWNPKAKFIILISQKFELSGKENTKYILASDIFSEFWRLKIVNVVIIFLSDITREDNSVVDYISLLDVYSWFPFKPVEHCGRVIDPILVDRWILKSGKEQFLKNEFLFPPKIPRNMQGCPLRISTFEYGPMMLGYKQRDDGGVSYNDGTDFHVLVEIGKFLNMTLHFLPPPPDMGFWGVQLENGSWNGMAGEVIRGFADIGAIGVWNKCHLILEMDCSKSYMTDNIRWYVPCAKPNPRWTSITRVFKASLWIGFVITYIFVGLAMYFVVKISNSIAPLELQNQSYAGVVKCLLNFWAIILEESASNDLPEIFSIRSIFLAWVLYCWAVNNVYQTFLTSFLVDPGLQKQISSETELFASGIPYQVFPATASHDKIFLSSKYPKILFCTEITVCFDSVAYHDKAFVYSQVATEYLISVKYMNADGDRIICDFDEIISSQVVTFPVMKGFPKLREFNMIIQYILEAGLVGKWFNNIKYLSALALAKTFNLPPGEYIKLSMNHLQSAFYFLIIGYILSILAFIAEIFSMKRVQKKAKIGGK